MNEYIFSVEQLNVYLKSILDAEELLRNIKITGEISGFKVSGRHAYFDLKDSVSQIPCVFFDFKDKRPPDGGKVVLSGTVQFHAARGRISFLVKEIETVGEGDLYKQFVELKARLEKEGLFDRKILPPKHIKRIGVITSATGAVIHDIATVAFRRDPSVDIVLYPVKVQGIGAAEEIASAIVAMDKYKKTDVVVVARGGGSMEDLAAYNTEKVARAVADCKKYIISAVGHETDFSLSDFCADLRAATPSAAAELLTRDRSRDAETIRLNLERIHRIVAGQLYQTLSDTQDAIDRLNSATQQKAKVFEHNLERKLYGLNDAVQRKWRIKHSDTLGLLQKLDMLNPIAVLSKGYAVAYRDDQRIRNVKDLKQGDQIDLRFADGQAIGRITEIKTGEK